jgi:purine-nucleoside phosphorylase
VRAAAEELRRRLVTVPRIAVVLGSGLNHLADEVQDPVTIPFEDLSGFVPSGVEGHSGRFVAGSLDGTLVLLQAGRYHAYEGHDLDFVVAPVRVLSALGVEVMVFTNAAGGIDGKLGPGDLVLLDDHINMMFANPLIGPVKQGEARFPDMSRPYDRELQDLAREVAERLGVALSSGIYAAVLGPSYETAAEVKMLTLMGANVVGMSTVPEVIAARALGVRCMGFSMVTNKGTGLSQEPIGHDQVIEVGQQIGARLGGVISGVAEALAASSQSVGAK